MEQWQGRIMSGLADRARSGPSSLAPTRLSWPSVLTACGVFAIACAGAASLGSTTLSSQRATVHQASIDAWTRKPQIPFDDIVPPAPMTMEEAAASSIESATDDGECADCDPFATIAGPRAAGHQAVVHRLAAPVRQEWQYDALGNITFNTHRGNYHYEDPERPMRVTRVDGGGVGTNRLYSYDAVGNQTGRAGVKVVYNERNLPARLLRPDGATVASFLYGPGGERVRKTSSTGSVTSVRGLYELHRNGANIEHRLIVPGIAILSYKQSGNVVTRQAERYLHTDHLGSTIAITGDDDAGMGLKATVKEARSYDAFGLARNPDWKDGGYAGIEPALSVQGYTGHNDDAELGLIDMKGRIYDPLLGRFLSADPLISNPAATQPWHPYAYVDNNPLRDTDPSGFLKCVAMRVSGHGTWVCATGGGDGGGGDRNYVDIRTGDRVVDLHLSGGNHDPYEGPDGHPVSDREVAKLEAYDEDPVRQSGQQGRSGRSGGVPSSAGGPGFVEGSGLSDADVDAICRATGMCADEVTAVAQLPDRSMYGLISCDPSNASCDFDAEPQMTTDAMEQDEREFMQQRRDAYRADPEAGFRIEPDQSLRINALKEWDRWSKAEKQRFLRDPSRVPHQNWYKPNIQRELHRIREEAGNGGIYRPLETLIPRPVFPESPYGQQEWDAADPDEPRPPISL